MRSVSDEWSGEGRGGARFAASTLQAPGLLLSHRCSDRPCTTPRSRATLSPVHSEQRIQLPDPHHTQKELMVKPTTRMSIADHQHLGRAYEGPPLSPSSTAVLVTSYARLSTGRGGRQYRTSHSAGMYSIRHRLVWHRQYRTSHSTVSDSTGHRLGMR